MWGVTAVGERIFREHSTISRAISKGAISRPVTKAIEACYGVPYEAYKKKPIEEINPKIDVPEFENQEIKEIAILLREVCNNQLAIYKRLNHLTGVGTRIEELLKGE